jgi:glycosyltransferase involved in cell wall biosynthesis
MLVGAETLNRVEFAIAIPAFGEPKYLRETLLSAIKSQNEDVRIIVIDDHSPSPFIENLCSKYSDRIGYIRNERNLGVSGNFNYALSVANADFVMLLGPDDILFKDIKSIVNFRRLYSEKVVAIHSNVITIDSKSRHKSDLISMTKKAISPKRSGTINPNYLKLSLLVGNWTYNPAIIWNTTLLPKEPFSPKLRYCMDWNLLIELSFNKGMKSHLLNDCFFKYRRHNESVSMSDPKSRYLEELLILRNIKTRNNTLFYHERLLCDLALIPRVNFLISRTKKSIGSLWHIVKSKGRSV